MKALVFSDSHGKTDCIIEIMNKSVFDMIIHLGDNSEDVLILENHTNKPIYKVKGNCDYYDINTLEEKIITIAGKKVFLTHGHRYNVKNNYNQIYYRGKELGVDLVLFGHTHVTFLEKDEDIILFNPGSISLPKMSNVGTYGYVDFQNNEITINVKKL